VYRVEEFFFGGYGVRISTKQWVTATAAVLLSKLEVQSIVYTPIRPRKRSQSARIFGQPLHGASQRNFRVNFDMQGHAPAPLQDLH
jgi:hypothetical protein